MFGHSMDGVFHQLGSFEYDLQGSPVQTFPVKNKLRFARVKMDINTNWGNEDYTCIYRIRVHGNSV